MIYIIITISVVLIVISILYYVRCQQVKGLSNSIVGQREDFMYGIEIRERVVTELEATIEEMEADMELDNLYYNDLAKEYDKAKTEISMLAKHDHKQGNERQRLISWLRINEPTILKRYDAENELGEK